MEEQQEDGGRGRPHLASFVQDFRRYGSQIAIVSRLGLRKQSSTYGHLADLASGFAAELNRGGIQKGDRVLIWGANNEEWIAAFFGCVLRGVVAVPLDVTGAASFTQRVIKEVAPKLITGSHDLLRELKESTELGLPHFAFEDFPALLQRPPLEAPRRRTDGRRSGPDHFHVGNYRRTKRCRPYTPQHPGQSAAH